MPKQKFDVVIPDNHPDPPDKYEQRADEIKRRVFMPASAGFLTLTYDKDGGVK
jgi:hypothetical protein